MVSQLLLWAPFALATTYAQVIQLPTSGTLRPGPGDSPAILQIFEAAGQHPNETDSITFVRDFNDAEETWTWRVNVTDIAVPNKISDLGDPSASSSTGYHVANTQWQLQWPGNNSSSLQSFLAERNLNVTFNALSIFLTSNITSKYNADDRGNCTNLLGSKCTQAISDATRHGNAMQLGFPDCRDTIGINGFTQPGGASNLIVSNPNQTGESTLHPNGTLFYTTSKTDTRSATTEFDKAKHSVQLLAMVFESAPGVIAGDPVVLCRIVEKAEGGGGGDGQNEGDGKPADQPETGAAGGSIRSAAAVMWGVVVLSAIVVML